LQSPEYIEAGAAVEGATTSTRTTRDGIYDGLTPKLNFHVRP
jgi:hypothetical protein